MLECRLWVQLFNSLLDTPPRTVQPWGAPLGLGCLVINIQWSRGPLLMMWPEIYKSKYSLLFKLSKSAHKVILEICPKLRIW